MAVSLVITEEDLRSMPIGLREELLGWYFGRPFGLATVPDSTPDARPPAPATPPPLTPEAKRLSFPDLLRARLLSVGDEILCRSLKRQRRTGGDKLIAGAKVLQD